MSPGTEDASVGKPSLLLVDDDPLITESLTYALAADFTIYACGSRQRALDIVRGLEHAPQLALVDLGLPPSTDTPDEGFQLIPELLAHARGMRIFVLSGQSEDANARHARALGAVDYLPKPCNLAALKSTLLRAAEQRAHEVEANRIADRSLVGNSAAIVRLRAQLTQFADSSLPVLIAGETGSGKKSAALALHRSSPRAAQPIVTLNCGASDPAATAATLFGYVRGAFDGAAGDKSGLIEAAQGGTLVLDAIGDLPLALQGKLLGVLERGTFERVGEALPRACHARIVATTNRDLRPDIRRGIFREDLYYGLSVYTIAVPALRDREADKLPLMELFRSTCAAPHGAIAFDLDETARARWLSYVFPGNVRELRNIVMRLAAKFPGRVVTAQELDLEFDLAPVLPELPGARGEGLYERALQHLGRGASFKLDGLLQSWEDAYLRAALDLARGNMSQAAKLLGIHRTTLYSRMQSRAEGAPDTPSVPASRRSRS